MKYQIVKNFISRNRSKKTLEPIGVVCHETANPGATAQNHFTYFNSGDRKASVHAFVDWEQIIQTIPWTEKAWHAGTTANNRYLGIELCHPQKHDEVKFLEVWKRGVWLHAYLFVELLKISTISDDNLLSHDDCRRLYKDTSHTDPIGLFKEYGKTMNDFRREVQAEIQLLFTGKEIRKAIVIVWKLNVREEPDSTAKIVGQCNYGDTLNVIEEKKGWYRVGECQWVSSLCVDLKRN